MTVLLVILAVAQLLCLLNLAVEQHYRFRQTQKRIATMDTNETQAFADLNNKVDALATAVTGLSSELTTENQALKNALAANDSAGVVAAAQALSAKVDAALATATAALPPPAPPAPAPAPTPDPTPDPATTTA